MRGEKGAALLVVLVILLAVAASSASFIWFMHQQQARAGIRYRSAAALAIAEAGLQQTLASLEADAPNIRARARALPGLALSGSFSIGPLTGLLALTLTHATDGGITITSAGEVGGVTRRLRARVYLASPALLASLYAASMVRLEGQGAVMRLLPHGAASGDRPWVHIATRRGVWFATPGVSINDRAAPADFALDPAHAPGASARSSALPDPGPVRLLLASEATLMVDRDYRQVDIQQLRALGIGVEGVTLRAGSFPPAPEVDRAFYRGLAVANTANASINEAAGEHLGDRALARKRDSLYSQYEFQQVQTYLQGGRAPQRLRGVIYVTGGLSLPEGQRLHIAEGALIAEHTVWLHPGASMEVTRTAATRALPALLVLGDGALFVMEEARLRAHGLVYVNRLIDVHRGARVDVTGAVLGNDPAVGFRNDGATVVIRYDPAVLGTPGLRVPDGAQVIAWVAVWEELP